ncbi:MAG: MerR family transcriptional regulator [Propionibacteriaceae bacterium]|jgi:DNA-binding transcriptional MerR regulator|nr:MerR family transcriptional regulator [Propionibacteriaceae bacterium]
MAVPGLAIGKVLSLLKTEFPDISISKIRFLESEGLITPERAPSGFRRYSKADVERLRYILSAQKNNYLPLKVIRENLDLIDQGIEPASPEPIEPPRASPVDPPASPVGSIGGQRPPVRLTREELLERSGLPEASMIELERQGIIRLRRGTAYYGWEALTLAIVAVKVAPLGIEARQLRVVKAAADREVELINLAASPYIRRPQMARQATLEIAEVIIQAHAALLQVGLDHS